MEASNLPLETARRKREGLYRMPSGSVGRIPPKTKPPSHKVRRAEISVFFISMAIVMGPTPPGTGVMAAHFDATSS